MLAAPEYPHVNNLGSTGDSWLYPIGHITFT